MCFTLHLSERISSTIHVAQPVITVKSFYRPLYSAFTVVGLALLDRIVPFCCSPSSLLALKTTSIYVCIGESEQLIVLIFSLDFSRVLNRAVAVCSGLFAPVIFYVLVKPLPSCCFFSELLISHLYVQAHNLQCIPTFPRTMLCAYVWFYHQDPVLFHLCHVQHLDSNSFYFSNHVFVVLVLFSRAGLQHDRVLHIQHCTQAISGCSQSREPLHSV